MKPSKKIKECLYCKSIHNKKSLYCKNCGAKLSIETEEKNLKTTNTETNETENKINTTAITVISIIITIIAFIILYTYGNYKATNKITLIKAFLNTSKNIVTASKTIISSLLTNKYI